MIIGPSSRFSVPDFGFGRAFAPFLARASSPDEPTTSLPNEATRPTERESREDAQAKTSDISPADQARIDELKKIDRRVRAHESAHLLAGSGVVRSGASFTYVSGPDGRTYAVGGEVSIDASPGQTASETIDKANAIVRAALAPVDPSGQDRRVAAAASAMAATARAELASERLRAAGGRSRDGDAVALYEQVGRDPGERRLLAVA